MTFSSCLIEADCDVGVGVEKLFRCRLYTAAAYIRKHSRLREVENMTLVRFFLRLSLYFSLMKIGRLRRRYIRCVEDARNLWLDLPGGHWTGQRNPGRSAIVWGVNRRLLDARSGEYQFSFFPIRKIKLMEIVGYRLGIWCFNVRYAIMEDISRVIGSSI